MSLAACAELVRRGDPDRFLATMATAPARRAVLFPLYAFNLEVARAPWLTAEPLIAEMRLQWWRDVLGEIASSGPVRRHEVATPLADALDAEGARLLDGLVEARRRDIAGGRFADQARLAAYLDATAGHLLWTAARLTGADRGERALREIAYGAGLANLFLAAPELARRGRAVFPDASPQALAALSQGGLARLTHARPPRAARPALLVTWRARAILRRAARDPMAIAEGRLQGSEFRRRWGLMLRALAV